jgi:hypothetical protein
VKYLLVLAVSLLPGCAVPVFIASVASVGVNESTGRTVSDHVVSSINGQDCKISRSFNGQDMCQEETLKLQVTESQYKASTVAEIQSRYSK